MPLRGTVPAWATSTRLVRPAEPSSRLDVQVVIGWRNAGRLASLLASATDPKSAGYGRFVTPAQFRAAFAPAAATVARVSAWLRGQGLSVAGGPKSRLWIEATGTVARFERAFDTTIGVYSHKGQLLRAPSQDPSVPSSLAGIIRGVTGLDDAEETPFAPPPRSYTVGTPCSKFWAEKIASDQPPAYGTVQPYAPCGYAPRQIQDAYGLTGAIRSGTDGTGVTVAVIDAYADPTLVSDLRTYSHRHGLKAPDITVKRFGPYPRHKHNQSGWYGEQALDVDAVHSTAPGASILFVGAKNSKNGLAQAMAWVLDNHAADETTNSYGYYGENVGASVIREYEALFQQAAAEGIGTYFSSGDDGDEIQTLGYRTTDYPPASPWVTAVGGTSLGVGADGGYLFETGWGTGISQKVHGAWQPDPPGDYLYGGGGGTSRIFAEPSYQVGVVPESLSGYFGGSGRVVPDIATLGDPSTGLAIGITQTFPGGVVRYGEYRIGGTSLSSPLMAGIMALAQQRAGHALGFANPALYQAYATDPSITRDIRVPSATIAVARSDWVGGDPKSGKRTYSLRTMDQTGTLRTGRGYDDVTGVGTPNGEAFLDAFA